MDVVCRRRWTFWAIFCAFGVNCPKNSCRDVWVFFSYQSEQIRRNEKTKPTKFNKNRTKIELIGKHAHRLPHVAGGRWLSILLWWWIVAVCSAKQWNACTIPTECHVISLNYYALRLFGNANGFRFNFQARTVPVCTFLGFFSSFFFNFQPKMQFSQIRSLADCWRFVLKLIDNGTSKLYKLFSFVFSDQNTISRKIVQFRIEI